MDTQAPRGEGADDDEEDTERVTAHRTDLDVAPDGLGAGRCPRAADLRGYRRRRAIWQNRSKSESRSVTIARTMLRFRRS